MGISDIIILNLYSIKSLVPCILFILACTVAAFFVILLGSQGMWFGKKSFERYNLFIELNSILAIKLACAWIKVLTIGFYLLFFAVLEPIHYVFLLVPCIGVLVINNSIVDGVAHLASVVIQLVGVLAANILCSYISQFGIQFFYISIYVLMAIVIELYSLYIFITELDLISNRRNVKIEKKRIQRVEEK